MNLDKIITVPGYRDAYLSAKVSGDRCGYAPCSAGVRWVVVDRRGQPIGAGMSTAQNPMAGARASAQRVLIRNG